MVQPRKKETNKMRLWRHLTPSLPPPHFSAFALAPFSPAVCLSVKGSRLLMKCCLALSLLLLWSNWVWGANKLDASPIVQDSENPSAYTYPFEYVLKNNRLEKISILP